MYSVAIVGGGISGLAAAHCLDQVTGGRVAVTVLEAEPRAGGKMQTEKVGGFVIEHGPNGFLDSKPEPLHLAEQVGATSLVLRAAESSARRFVLRGGRLVQVPEGPGSFLTSPILSPWGKARILLETLIPRRKDSRGPESVYDFARRRLGREAADYLVDPMVSGIYAGDPRRLGVCDAFPKVYELEHRYGGLIRGMLKTMKQRRGKARQRGGPAGPGGWLTSFRGGVQSLVERVVSGLGRRVRTGVRVTSVQRDGSSWRLRLQEGTTVTCDCVILSCQTFEAAKIVGDLDQDVAQELADIYYAPILVVATAFRKGSLEHDLDGFGFVVPSSESEGVLGCLWDSSIFEDRAPGGFALVRSMLGGARHPDLVGISDREAVDVATSLLSRLGLVKGEPHLVRVYRHERGIPQYEVGHAERCRRIERRLSELGGIFVCHNAFWGIGLGDCVRNAEVTARKAWNWLEREEGVS